MAGDFDRRSLGPLALLAILAITFVAAALGVLIALQFQRVELARAWVSHTDAVLLTTAELRSAVGDAERGQRGYLITGRRSYLDPYLSSLQQIPRLLARLSDLTADNPAQHARVAKIGKLVDRKMGELAQTISLRERSNAAAAEALVETDEGLGLMQAMGAQLQGLVGAERQLLAARLKTAQRQQNLANRLVGIGMAVVVLLLVTTAWLVRLAQAALTRQAQQLNRVVDDLRQQGRRKDDFLATLAHELRNPLAPIQSSADLLSHEALSATAVVNASNVIRRQVRHMSRLLEDLLTLTRLAHGKLQLHATEVPARECIEAAIEMIKPFIDRKHQRLVVQLPPPTLRLVADGARLTQVVANLLANASKFSDEHCQIELKASERASELVLSIVDHGIGIPRDALPRLFDRFYQVGASGGRDGAGLGIGLALAKELVALHGGSISVSSGGANLGTTAVVTFPLTPRGRGVKLAGDAAAHAQTA